MSKKVDKELEGPMDEMALALTSIISAKGFRDDILNHMQEGTNAISSGSLFLDRMVGYQPPGIIRLIGSAGGGKTSCALSYLRDFLKGENCYGLLVRAEGRLSDKVKKRSQIEFVRDPSLWRAGTCFTLECNVYGIVFHTIENLIKHADEKGHKLFFIIDSTDGLIKKEDKEKTFDEETKVAGGAAIASLAMKKISLPLSVLGHYMVLISQRREEIKISQYAPTSHQMKSSASGGNALLHYPSLILEFYEDARTRTIFEKSNPKIDAVPPKNGETGKMIGRWAKAKIIKSDEDVRGCEVEYPIYFDGVGDDSIWWQMEVYNYLASENYFSLAGSWVTPADKLNEKLKEAGLEPVEKTQGELNFWRMLQDERPEVLELFQQVFKEEILNKNSVTKK